MFIRFALQHGHEQAIIGALNTARCLVAFTLVSVMGYSRFGCGWRFSCTSSAATVKSRLKAVLVSSLPARLLASIKVTFPDPPARGHEKLSGHKTYSGFDGYNVESDGDLRQGVEPVRHSFGAQHALDDRSSQARPAKSLAFFNAVRWPRAAVC